MAENKFAKREDQRTISTGEVSQNSLVSAIAKKKSVTRKMMSMNVDPEIYEKFQFITKKLSTNASAVLCEHMYTYVKEHEDLL
jgi:predicted DNA-binding protein